MKKEYKKEVSMKKAFTLAEVLITLTIIGVIAALTIPNLMQSYKKHQVEVGVKEAYSILSNAIKMAVAENGPIEEWSSGQSHVLITKYLKVISNCGCQAFGTGNKINCFTWRYLNEDANGTDEKGTYDSIRCYQATLANGMRVCLDYGEQEKKLSDYYTLFAAVDINGKKKTPIVGKDVFFFTIDVPTSSLLPGYQRMQYHVRELKARAADYYITNNYQYYCNTSSRQGGGHCTSAIAKNGWKIPDNYPVKKW